VDELGVKVPENTPLASITPVPRDAPVVGAIEVSECVLRRITQVVQLAVIPPPVTVTVEPRVAVVGVKLTKLVIA
jgi:hypothetical protein